MKEAINKETLEKLLTLSRIELTEEEKKNKEPKLLKDLQRILEHFEELNEINTEEINIIEGGKAGVNEYRKDEEKSDFRKEDATDQFPNTQNGYLKVPAILEHKKRKDNGDS